MINPRSLRLKAVAISWLNWSGSEPNVRSASVKPVAEQPDPLSMPSFITLGDFNFSKLCSAMRPEEKPWPPTSEGSGVDITIKSAA
jgi:hypothetical protein